MLNPLLSIIMPCFNAVRHTRWAVESIVRTTEIPFELILINNGSTDGTQSYLSTLRSSSRKNILRIRNRTNKGVAAAVNQGLRIARGRFIVYLNNDIIATRGWADRLISCARSKPDIGMVGPVVNTTVTDADLGRSSPAPRIAEIEAYARLRAQLFRGKLLDIPVLHGWCMLMKRSLIRKVGVFDERFFPCAGEDIDYSYRVRYNGFRIVKALDTYIHHFHSRSTFSPAFSRKYGGIETVMRRSHSLLDEKWHGILTRGSNDVEPRSA